MANRTLPTTRRIDRAVAGGPITATGYNQLVDAIDDGRRGVALPSQVKPPLRPKAVGTLTVRLGAVFDDYLECETADGRTILALMPDLLRRSRRNGKLLNGVLLAFTGVQRVDASKASEKNEVWKITPQYDVTTPIDDREFLKIAPLDEDGKETDNAFLKGLDIVWYDTNEAGRTWGVDIEDF